MSVSSYLEFTLMEAAQSQPEVVFNEMGDALDRAVSGWFVINGTTETFPLTIADEDGRNRTINIWNDPGAAYTIIVPSKKRHWAVVNDTQRDLTIKTAAGTGVVIPAWQRMHIFSDGTNVHGETTAIVQEQAISDGIDIVVGSSTGTKIATETTQKLGFFNATPVTQRSAITSPSGGSTIDTEARAAIDSLRQALIDLGFTA
jgi:hypothetical protein